MPTLLRRSLFPALLSLCVLPAAALGASASGAPASSADRESTAPAADPDLALAKTYLKDYLKALNKQYPFADWEKQLAKARKSLDKAKEKSQKGGGGGRGFYSTLVPLSREVGAVVARRPDAVQLAGELQVATLVARVETLFVKQGRRMAPETRIAFQRALMPYEAGSLKPKQAFLGEVAALDREFRRMQTDWLFAFAQDHLGRRVEEHLRVYNFAQNEAIYDDYTLQLDYWSKEIDDNAPQAHEQLAALSGKFEAARGRIRKDLDALVELLNTDMLFSDLLEHARKEEVEFTIEVEEKIEASLKERSHATVAPIHERLAAWRDFTAALSERVAESRAKMVSSPKHAGEAFPAHGQLGKAETQRSRQPAREESDRREQERLEALKQAQARQERDQKEKFKQTLTALKTFTFKGETAVELDDESTKALKTKAGFLRTSYVRSGSQKLKVDKGAKFSDTLAFVQKFSVEEGGVDFSKMSLQERTNQSAYTYASPSGRTSNSDLEEFVAEVALGSFSTYYSFLSYNAPSRWKPGRLGWTPDRAQEKAAQDREFSYVDLVVDAHKKRPGAGQATHAAGTVNLPANMIVIFDPKGAIIRFQSFSDVGQISIQPGDLVGGKLHYKFLNYSVDRRNIYLNGIDQEIKVSAPGGEK